MLGEDLLEDGEDAGDLLGVALDAVCRMGERSALAGRGRCGAAERTRNLLGGEHLRAGGWRVSAELEWDGHA